MANTSIGRRRVESDDLLDRQAGRRGDLGEVGAVIEHGQDDGPARRFGLIGGGD